MPDTDTRPKVPLSFEALLTAMVLFLFVPVLAHVDWISKVSASLYTIVMLASLYLVSKNRKDLVIGIVLFVPVFTTKWALAPFMAAETQLLSYCVFQVIFLSYVMSKVYGFLLAARNVDTEIIYASIILYLMFGLCLSLVYYGTIIVTPGALGEQLVLDVTDEASITVMLHNMIYYSFVTQTTLGYGDISPTSEFARTVAAVHAIMGQIYVAVIIARLVGIQIATTLAEKKH